MACLQKWNRKEIGVSGSEIIKFGVENFNDHCQKSVMKYTQDRKSLFTDRQMVDFENDYKTMDISYGICNLGI